MLVIGIDPGASGALVSIEDGTPKEYLHMPMTLFSNSTKVIHTSIVASWLRSHKPDFVVIESVFARPNQGVTSMFSFGRSYGTLEGIVHTLGYPLIHVTPQRWKKHYSFIGLPKDAPRLKALNTWTHLKDLKLKGKGQALADAIYIGKFGIHIYTQG